MATIQDYKKALKELKKLGRAILKEESATVSQLEEVDLMEEHIDICLRILSEQKERGKHK